MYLYKDRKHLLYRMKVELSCKIKWLSCDHKIVNMYVQFTMLSLLVLFIFGQASKI